MCVFEDTIGRHALTIQPADRDIDIGTTKHVDSGHGLNLLGTFHQQDPRCPDRTVTHAARVRAHDLWCRWTALGKTRLPSTKRM